MADESVVVTDDVALVTADDDVTGLSVGYGLTEPESDPDVVTVTVCVVEWVDEEEGDDVDDGDKVPVTDGVALAQLEAVKIAVSERSGVELVV